MEAPATANDWLLNVKLKKQMGFKGFVISDASAVGGANVLHMTAKDYPDASANAINNGLDVIFQTGYDHYKLFIPPFLDGRIDKKKIDEAVARVLRIKFQLGLFEQPYINESEAAKWNGIAEHRAIAKKAALESIVLLKNEGNILPLSKNIKSIAVIGLDATEARLGGYSGPGNKKINILDGIKNKLGDKVNIHFAPGCGRSAQEYTIIPSENLLLLSRGKMKMVCRENTLTIPI